MRRLLFPILIPLALLQAAPAQAVAPGTMKLPPFDAIDAGGNFTIAVTIGKPQSVSFSGDAELLERVEAQVKGRVLELRIKKGPWSLFKRSEKAPRATITVERLEKAKLSGACKLDASGLAGPALDVSLSGACKAVLAGKVETLDASLSGACTLDAEILAAAAAELDLSGACKAMVNASKKLKVVASGANKVEYLGNPALEQDISGVSSLHHRGR